MKYNQLYNDSLYTFFCRDNYLNIFSILRTFNGINVLYENGFFFNYVISKGNVEICKALITYFEQKQFPIKNDEYEKAKEKLVELLENAVDGVKLSKEMKEALIPYLDLGDNLDISNDSLLGGIELQHEFETVSTLENTDRHKEDMEDMKLSGDNNEFNQY